MSNVGHHEKAVLDQAFLQDVASTEWFINCGRSLPATNSSFMKVASWQEVAKRCIEPAWDDALLEARNELTEFLHKNYLNDYQRWNEITEAAKAACVVPLTDLVWKPFAMKQSLPEQFVHSVQWIVLAAIMEHEYRGSLGRPTFFLDLFSVLRGGHVPCGWSGSPFPLGTPCVF
jgi:hypothetical protein